MGRRFELEKYGNVYSISLEVNSYVGGNLAIQMYSWEDGYPEPWALLMVNLGGIREKDCAFIDINHNGQKILAWITRYGLAVPTGRFGCSGFCSYPEYRFKETALREIDPDGYEDYLKSAADGK